MAEPRVIEGTWDDFEARADELRRYGWLRLVIPADDEPGGSATASPRGIRFGMFPELGDLAEEDFQAAEWHGEDLEA